MSRKGKYRLAAIALTVACLAFGVAYLVLSSRTFYPDLVFSKVQAALTSSVGYDLSADRLEGNPITGVYGRGVTISQEGVAVMTAERIEMRLALRSLLSGKPKLARMTLVGLRADYDRVILHPPAKREAGKAAEPPALDTLLLLDAAVRTKMGVLSLDRGMADIGADRYDVNLRGSFAEKPISLKGLYIKEGNAGGIERTNLDWGGQKVRAEGTLSPSLSLACELEDIDIDVLASVLPVLKKSTVVGVFGGKLTVEEADGLRVNGTLESNAGRVWRLPFSSLQADVTYEKRAIGLSNVKATIFGAEAEGSARILLTEGTPPNLSARFGVRNLETAAMVSEFDFIEKTPASVAFASCDLRGPVNCLSGPIYLDILRLRAGDFDVTASKAHIVLRGEDPLRVDFSGTILGSSATASGTVALSSPNSLDITASLHSLSLAALAKQYPEAGKMKLAGEGVVSAKVRGPANGLTTVGSVSFPTLSVQGYVLDGVKADFVLGASGLSLPAARARWNGAEIAGSGEMRKGTPGSPEKALNFQGVFSKLDLKTLGEQVGAIKENDIRGVVAGRWAVRGDEKDPAASFDISVPQLTVGEYVKLSDVDVQGSYRSADIQIERAGAKLGGASVTAAGRVSLPAKNVSPLYEFKGRFAGLSLHDLPALLETVPGSADLSAEVNGDFRAWAGEGEKPQARIFFKDSALTAKKVEILDLRGGVEFAGGEIRLRDILARLYQGRLRLNGSIAAMKDGEGRGLPIDLRLEATSIDVGRVARIFSPSAHGYQGLIVASADIRGTTASPRFSADGSIQGVRAFGLFLPRIRFANINGGPESIRLPEIQAIVGRGRINANGELTREADRWTGSVKANGKSVDIRSMTFSLEDEMRRTITGALDFDFEGAGSIASFQGSGTLSMPTLNVMGFKLTNARVPFFVSDGFAMVEDSSAIAYGGTVMLQIAKDLKASNWGGRVEISSADLAPILPDLMPGESGRISGRTNFKVRFGGDSRRTSMHDGEGSIEVTDGEVSGFEGTAALSKVTGGRPLRFKSLTGSFNIDGKTLHLLPGSRVAAPKGDPVFKYVMADGSISLAKSIDLSCVGNVNIRALNIFAGAMQGLMVAAVDGSDGLLQNFLGGAITGLSRNEFRDVSLQANGAPGALKFQDVKIAQQEKVNYMPDALAEPENARAKEQNEIKINLEFPVGPGSSGSGGEGAASQVGGQVLEQAIKGALHF